MQSSHNHFIATTKEIQAKHVFYSTNRRLHVSGLVSFSVTIISQALYNAQVTTTLNQAPVDMSIFRVDQVLPLSCSMCTSAFTIHMLQVQRESAVEFYYATSWASAMAESASSVCFFFNRFFQSGVSLNCHHMFQCLITVIKLGLLSNPPLGDVSCF